MAWGAAVSGAAAWGATTWGATVWEVAAWEAAAADKAAQTADTVAVSEEAFDSESEHECATLPV